MLKDWFEELLPFLKNKKILLSSHELVDLDGFSSAVALYFFLNQFIQDSTLYLYFSDISKKTQSFYEKLKLKFPEMSINIEKDISTLDIDTVIILDANNINQLPFLNDLTNILDELNYIFIDHHYSDEKIEKQIQNNKIIIDEYTSTAELISEIFFQYQIKIPLFLKYLLLGGILSDSGFLRLANTNTIKTVSILLEPNMRYQELILMMRQKSDISQKIAKIKGTQRVELIRESEYLIGYSHVSSFESGVAATLIKIGFDIGIVFSERKKEYRISMRANKRICVNSDLHLGKIAQQISKEYGGQGGGHDGAASITLDIKQGDLKTIILQKIKENLN
ncbi:MAG: hypothetical protein GF317_06320 [Candidatus Lokiarchaeota archaeon]|nr:hypothetical protein [Candidatus Lokiarchaeota archaeon]MBD3199337.1 hypothetical protein [Candidatus Lokiarchaeota archaeon]